MIPKTKGSGRRATFFRLAYVYLVCRMKVISIHEINLVITRPLMTKKAILKKSPAAMVYHNQNYLAAALVLASFVHNCKCLCSSFRIALTVVPNFLFFTSLATEVNTS